MVPCLILLLALAPPSVVLRDAGGPSRCELTLTVRGKLKVTVGDKTDDLPLTATASHTFAEYPDRPGRGVRLYESATSTATVSGERSLRELPLPHRRIVAHQTPDGLVHYSPVGPLTRDELELVSEHLMPSAIAALLPSKAMGVNESWAVPVEAVRAICHLDGVGQCALIGTLTAGGPQALFAIAGTADGVENGASVKLTVKATGTFDVATSRVTKLTWEQTDVRAQGPASPASEITAIAELTRTPTAADPAAGAKLPADDTIPDSLLNLHYADPRGRFRLTLPRSWHVVGRAPDHLVFRLLDRGEFVAQATVAVWKPVAAGKHTPADEFRAALAKLPGWEPEAMVSAGELTAPTGHWLYRVAARGKQDGHPMIHAAYLLAAPSGSQLAVGVLATPEKAGVLAGRDERLVRAVELK